MFPYDDPQGTNVKIVRENLLKKNTFFRKKVTMETQLQAALNSLQKETEARQNLEMKNKQFVEENESLKRSVAQLRTKLLFPSNK